MTSKTFIRLRAELSDGYCSWSGPEEYSFGSEEEVDHLKEARGSFSVDYEFFLEEAGLTDEEIRQSDRGIFLRESGEHGYIWLPKPPDGFSLHACNLMILSVRKSSDGWDAALQPTLGFFFSSVYTGDAAPLTHDQIAAALSHKIPIGSYDSELAAMLAAQEHDIY